ncbi:CUB and sushi domain-containing protein 1-like isoform X4 [Halichondria panicea]|uniref:CUB and sushi domain-containing protein 1-like isoform X4 n=1 Tax=Halichondria panicea TaxID=6063 RepID=UPI00312B2EBF
MTEKLLSICLLVIAIVSLTVGQQVYLTLGSGPVITTDNTNILITTIGEDALGGLPSLTCHTDLTGCCRSNADNNGNGGLGQWAYPDGSVILGNGYGQQFYRIRNAPQLIRLNRRESNNPLTPTGSYCCTVPTTGGEMTLCVNLVVCLSLPPLTNGMLSYSDQTQGQGTVATYSCNHGRNLDGDATRTCDSNGVWSGSVPICQFTCSDDLPIITNGGVTYAGGSTNNRPLGATAMYICFRPYRLVGVSVRTCESNGTWSSSTAPVCQRIICSDLSLPTSGMITYSDGSTNNRPVNSSATHSCNAGYTLTGGDTRFCLHDGTWSESASVCQPQTIIQLKFGPTSHCLHWNEGKAATISGNMRQTIYEVIARSNKDIPLANIDGGVFSCRTSQNYTTFRTTIDGTANTNSLRAAAVIQEWVESGPVMRVEWYLVDVIGGKCPVVIDSLSEEECIENQCMESCLAVCRARG